MLSLPPLSLPRAPASEADEFEFFDCTRKEGMLALELPANADTRETAPPLRPAELLLGLKTGGDGPGSRNIGTPDGGKVVANCSPDASEGLAVR